MNTQIRSYAGIDLSRPARPRNNWPFLAFIVLIPLQNIYLQYFPNFGAGLNFLNIMAIASLLRAWQCRGRLISGTGINGWTYSYMVYSCIAFLIGLSIYIEPSAQSAMLKDQFIGIAFLFIAQMSANDIAAVRRLFLASLIPLPYIIWVIADQSAHASAWHYSHDLRVRGTFMELGANEMGAFCVTAMLMTSGLLLTTHLPSRWKLVLGSAFGLAAFGVVSSYSRTAYIASLIGLAIILFVPRGRVRRILPVMAAAVLAWTLLPPAAIERFDSITLESESRDKSTDDRFLFWEVATARIREHPIFGTGFATFQHPEVNPYQTDAHNFFLRELVEKGLIGGAILFGLLLSIYRLPLRTIRKRTPPNWADGFMVGLMAALLALIVGNLFGDRFTHYPMIAHFWLYVGLAMRIWQIECHTARTRQK